MCAAARIRLAVAVLALPAAMPCRAATLAVPCDANLYGAGHAVPPEPAGYGAGVLPPVASFPPAPGQTLTFTSVTGCVQLTTSVGSCHDADGDAVNVVPTGITSYGGLSGISHDTHGFLAAVFLDDTEPVDPAPPVLDFRAAALGTAFATLAPALNQVFFTGDGLTGTGSGTPQAFSVPPTATRLALGFCDGYGYAGPPGAYADNGGSVDATFEITGGCAAAVTSLPQDATICAGDTAILDASGMSLVNCAAGWTTEWSEPAGPAGSGPILVVAPAATTRYTVTLTCSSDPACTTSASAIVTVEEPPVFSTGQARDLLACNLGIEVSWAPAIFLDPSGSGTYAVYRSESSCADALARPPLATGLARGPYDDGATVDGHLYFYVVVAEDARAATACSPRGPNNGGAATWLCLAPATETSVAFVPEKACGVLRASHDLDDVTLSWPALRALRADEHVHLLWSPGVPAGPFVRVTPEGERGGAFVHVDTTAPLQFFDLRVSSACEVESAPEYPAPGLLDAVRPCP